MWCRKAGAARRGRASVGVGGQSSHVTLEGMFLHCIRLLLFISQTATNLHPSLILLQLLSFMLTLQHNSIPWISFRIKSHQKSDESPINYSWPYIISCSQHFWRRVSFFCRALGGRRSPRLAIRSSFIKVKWLIAEIWIKQEYISGWSKVSLRCYWGVRGCPPSSVSSRLGFSSESWH